MFQSLITFATLVAMGAHALFGCCWHHGHADHHMSCSVESSTEPEVVADHQCACHKACKTDQNAKKSRAIAVISASIETAPCDHSKDHESGECGEGRCQYLTNTKVELPSLDGPSLLSGLIPRTTDAASLSLNHSSLPTRKLAASLLSGSLCVRDLTQIALI